MTQTIRYRNSEADMRAWAARAAALPGVTVSCLLEDRDHDADGTPTRLYHVELTVDGDVRMRETRLSDPALDPAVVVARLRRERKGERRLNARTRRFQS